ncbi:MAG: hypothetical protein ACFFD2_18640 [Promethearchaeota archaeon]
MVLIKFTCYDEFIKTTLPDKSTNNNTQLLLEFTAESNKEAFLGEYIKYLTTQNVYTLLITPEGNSSFYLQNLSDYRIITIELSVSDSARSNFHFEKFGQIPLNENKILFSINNILNEFAGKRWLYIVFDSLSELILWLNFNTTYKFMRKCISNLRRVKKVSSCFLINKSSHLPEILSAFENLFDGILVSDAQNDCKVKGIIKYRSL